MFNHDNEDHLSPTQLNEGGLRERENKYSHIHKVFERKIKKIRNDKLLHPAITEHRKSTCICSDVWSMGWSRTLNNRAV